MRTLTVQMGQWTEEDVQNLLDLVKEDGNKSSRGALWDRVAASLPGSRSALSVRKKYDKLTSSAEELERRRIESFIEMKERCTHISRATPTPNPSYLS